MEKSDQPPPSDKPTEPEVANPAETPQISAEETRQNERKKLAELRRKAIQSASVWNSNLIEAKKRRKCFFDLATMTIQYPSATQKVAANTNFGAYPTAVIPGQFQNFYKNHSPEELYGLPLKTVVNTDRFVPKETILDFEESLERDLRHTVGAAGLVPARPQESESPGVVDIAKTDRGEDYGEHCAFCQTDIYANDRFVQCAKCRSCGHPSCMDMTAEMYKIVKSYPWECMECKPCSVCSHLDEEDRMLFCDRCDRGYHSFCVGLEDLPSGRWLCPLYCNGEGKVTDRPTVAIKREAGEKELSCIECGNSITKENKSHHRGKAKFCTDCCKKKRAEEKS